MSHSGFADGPDSSRPIFVNRSAVTAGSKSGFAGRFKPKSLLVDGGCRMVTGIIAGIKNGGTVFPGNHSSGFTVQEYLTNADRFF